MASLMQLKNSLPPNDSSDSRAQRQFKFSESQINLVLHHEIKGPENPNSPGEYNRMREFQGRALLNIKKSHFNQFFKLNVLLSL